MLLKEIKIKNNLLRQSILLVKRYVFSNIYFKGIKRKILKHMHVD